MNSHRISYTMERPRDSWSLQLPFFRTTLIESKVEQKQPAIHHESSSDIRRSSTQQTKKEDYIATLISSLRL